MGVFSAPQGDPAEPWRLPVDAEGPRANRHALRTIMDHWLGLGVSGFRVDMAVSLVKDAPGKTETSALRTESRHWLDTAHPEAALFSESGEPEVSIPAGFRGGFLLHFGGPTDGLAPRSLWDDNGGTVNEVGDPLDCFFDPEGRGSPRRGESRVRRHPRPSAGGGGQGTRRRAGTPTRPTAGCAGPYGGWGPPWTSRRCGGSTPWMAAMPKTHFQSSRRLPSVGG